MVVPINPRFQVELDSCWYHIWHIDKTSDCQTNTANSNIVSSRFQFYPFVSLIHRQFIAGACRCFIDELEISGVSINDDSIDRVFLQYYVIRKSECQCFSLAYFVDTEGRSSETSLSSKSVLCDVENVRCEVDLLDDPCTCYFLIMLYLAQHHDRFQVIRHRDFGELESIFGTT